MQDTKAVAFNIAGYCGPRLYTISPKSYFVSFVGDVMTLSSSSSADVGIHILDLKVTLRNFPQVPAFVTTFSVTIE